MANQIFNAFKVHPNLGHRRTAGAASASAALPVNSAGQKPKYGLVSVYDAGRVYVAFGTSGGAADCASGTAKDPLWPAMRS